MISGFARLHYLLLNFAGSLSKLFLIAFFVVSKHFWAKGASAFESLNETACVLGLGPTMAATWCCCARVSRVVLSGTPCWPLFQKTPVLSRVEIC